jgi:uncharacterized protein (DUF2141 family)
MLKLSGALLALVMALSGAAGPASADVLGPHAPMCANGIGPAMLIHIGGLKNRLGNIRVRTFGTNPADYFEKPKVTDVVEIPIPASGPVEICLRAATPGKYAVEVRHDINGNNKTDLSDGGGASGNPNVSIWSIIFKRKPAAEKVGVSAGQGVTPVPIIMKYVQGAALRPVAHPVS